LRGDLLTTGLERFSDLATYIKQESEEKLNPKEQRKKKQNLRGGLNNSDSQYPKKKKKKKKTPTKTQTNNKSQEQSKHIQQLVQEKKQLYGNPRPRNSKSAKIRRIKETREKR
jgi:hypothetical protein